MGVDNIDVPLFDQTYQETDVFYALRIISFADRMKENVRFCLRMKRIGNDGDRVSRTDAFIGKRRGIGFRTVRLKLREDMKNIHTQITSGS
jgi:hypothetical protein